MGANNSQRMSPDDRLISEIKVLRKQVADLKSNQLSVIVAPHYDDDPTSPIDGQLWYNVTSDQLKTCINGIIKVITVS